MPTGTCLDPPGIPVRHRHRRASARIRGPFQALPQDQMRIVRWRQEPRSSQRAARAPQPAHQTAVRSRRLSPYQWPGPDRPASRLSCSTIRPPPTRCTREHHPPTSVLSWQSAYNRRRLQVTAARGVGLVLLALDSTVTATNSPWFGIRLGQGQVDMLVANRAEHHDEAIARRYPPAAASSASMLPNESAPVQILEPTDPGRHRPPGCPPGLPGERRRCCRRHRTQQLPRRAGGPSLAVMPPSLVSSAARSALRPPGGLITSFSRSATASCAATRTAAVPSRPGVHTAATALASSGRLRSTVTSWTASSAASVSREVPPGPSTMVSGWTAAT